MAKSSEVPNVLKCTDPKSELEQLHDKSDRRDEAPLTVWPDIAARVDAKRCAHRSKTGFQAFVAEVETELGPLFAEAG